MTQVNINIMTSFLEGNISKEELIKQFDINKETFIEHDDNEWRLFLNNMAKLTWILYTHYKNISDNNKQVVLELIKQHLVYYFNYIHKSYDESVSAVGYYNLNPVEQDQHTELRRTENMLNSLTYFITRLHYRIEYFELRTLPFEELSDYIVMQNSQSSVYQLPKIISIGNEDDLFTISRIQIQNILQSIAMGNTHSAIDILQNILNLKTNTDVISTDVISTDGIDDVPSQSPPPIDPEKARKVFDMVNARLNTDSDITLNGLNDISENDLTTNLSQNIEVELLSSDDMIQNIGQDYQNIYDESIRDSKLNDSSLLSSPITEELQNEPHNTVELEWTYMECDKIVNTISNMERDIDTMEHIKTICQYMKTYYDGSMDINKPKQLAEIKYVVYLITFLKSESLI